MQSVLITIVSPKEKVDLMIRESAKIPSRILQRNKDIAGTSCLMLEDIRNGNCRDTHEPKLCEPTRQEKKRLLQESMKQRRKKRAGPKR